ncbi:forkhead box protein N2 [Xenopus tropicalis]|uniref:Forkhead box protein N2 n=1 Tax=Xenopus tropicalis TaxID=8364 RepID=FOXN2_XENTR|nr:forkhead box protein N2 [Xenopus tropicalis]Q28F43.1 RecName: Full=Forkhead box protein N2 [Xenopus tropicalis]CAJ83519.1 human T-cell leukemia virus enhancer factor [Xenopus tropicalis]|eukprot:NP_001017017.1 forkhead box protein N2 [Xenopus tropicalis]
MGPVTGMTPDKNIETPAAEKVPGLSQTENMGSLPEEVGAARPKASMVDSGTTDEELTNLNWLHESTNLLNNFSLGSEGVPTGSPLYDIEGDLSPSGCQTPEKLSASSKPPYSFSLLIYMAIEHSPNKCLPVKDIYSWILDRFPYFATAPTGWKNSVRHNLSLNKYFQKVERSHGKVNGKGSLWCVDPEYKPSLIQALKKQPFSSALALYTPPTSPTSVSSRSSVSSLSSVEEVYEFIPKNSRAGSDGSEGFHSEDDTDIDYEEDMLGDSGYVSQPCINPSSNDLHGNKLRKEACQDIDDELKEAAGSLLHLAGIRTCLDSLLKTAKAQSQKHRK